MKNKMSLFHAANGLILLFFAYFLFKGASDTRSLDLLLEWRGIIYISLLLSIIAFWYANRMKQDEKDMAPIIKVGDGVLCLSEESTWWLKWDEKEWLVEEDNKIVALLPLFENDYEAFKSAIAAHQIPPDVLALLPLKAAMKFPFDNNMTNWMEQALDWIEKSGMAIEMRDWALTIKRDTMPQAVMHRFGKVFDLPKGWDKPENP